MRIDVHHRPAYALATVFLDAHETVIAEAGAMVSMDTHVTISTSSVAPRERHARRGCLGWLWGGLKRMVRRKKFYQNRFYVPERAGSVTLAPKMPGDIMVHQLDETYGLVLQSASFLCHAATVGIDPEWGGTEAFLAGEGIYMLLATGEGPIAFSSFGALQEIDVEDHLIVDSSHIVAFEDSLSFVLRPFSRGWIKTVFGGESLVCEFTGRGRVWVQSHAVPAFGEIMRPMLPKKRSR